MGQLQLPGSLYVEAESFLHRLHPLTKLAFSLSAAVVIFGGPGAWPSAVIPGLLALWLLGRAGLGARALLAVARLLGWLAVALVVVHGFFSPQNQTMLWQWGRLALGQEGLQYAVLVWVRLAATLLASLALVFSTHPADLIQALEEARLPRGLAYVLGSPLLLMEQAAGRIQSIQAAQQARGLETGGGLRQRVRALFPLVAPLVYTVLVDVEERSLALEVRGFSAPYVKTHLRALPDSPAQRLARWAMPVGAFVLLLVGVWARAHGYH